VLTTLSSLGSGTAQAGSSGATLVTDRGQNIPTYFGAHWVEITSASGTLKGQWRIAPFTTPTKTMTLVPNGTETISIAPGDKWQGVYRFDNVKAPIAITVINADPIR